MTDFPTSDMNGQAGLDDPPQPVRYASAFGEGWRTSDEINFIDRIGYYRKPRRAETLDERIQLLKGYIEGISRRTYWIGMDSHSITQHAKKLLASYEALNQPKGI